MIHALVWLAVALFLALWSLTAWALHAAAVWALSNAGALSGVATDVGAIPLPAWLAPWVPAEMVQAVTQLIAGMAPLIDSLLQALPMLAGGLTVLAWGIWAVGAFGLVLLGVGGHVMVTLWRRRAGDGPGTAARLAPR